MSYANKGCAASKGSIISNNPDRCTCNGVAAGFTETSVNGQLYYRFDYKVNGYCVGALIAFQ